MSILSKILTLFRGAATRGTAPSLVLTAGG